MPRSEAATEDEELRALDRLVRAGHEAGEPGPLADGYGRAGDRFLALGAVDAACFYWTQAWIHALEAGERTLVRALEERLTAHGRLG